MNSIYVSNYALHLYDEIISPKSAAYHWLNFEKCMTGSTDVFARSGQFASPFERHSPYQLPLPDFGIVETNSLETLMDRRGVEIYQAAKRHNKKITMLWSGGLDSTAVLVSLLKAIPYNEQPDMLVICTSTDGVMENFAFYRQFISGRLRLIHMTQLDFGEQVLNDSFVLHGEPGDLLASPSWRLYRALMDDGRHRLPFRKNMLLLYRCHFTEGYTTTSKWYVDKVTENITATAPDDIETIADWFFWTGLNLRWECFLWFPFNSPIIRQDHSRPISPANTQIYFDNIFLHADYLQRWFYQHRQNIFLDETGTKFMYKYYFKNYIRGFDKNQNYFDSKNKVASISSTKKNGIKRIIEDIPVYYNENWVGTTLKDPKVYQDTLELLLDYKG